MALIKIADKYYKIPVYVQKLMSRASFEIGYGEPGHTLEIEKATPYTCVYTLRAEVERFVVWINRIMTKAALDAPMVVINNVPTQTHYYNQYAVVTVYDPVMQQLEKFMKK